MLEYTDLNTRTWMNVAYGTLGGPMVWTIFSISVPSEHMSFIQRRVNVDPTSWRLIKVYSICHTSAVNSASFC